MPDDTLPAFTNHVVPVTFNDLWEGFDPRAEPLEVEVLKEWEEDGVVLKVLRYRVGVFKGQKAMMAAVYGYPKGGTNLPGLVQIHGGGQYANHKAPLANARRGYATISIAWAGRVSAPGYTVGPNEVKLFWDGATNDPNYKLTTDWGALDAYHAPCRYPGTDFGGVKPTAWTLDPVESPRNSAWFLCTIAARRAVTLLERQPEVDASKLGVYGHSMGGQLTVALAGTDARIKAAAPSCGGISYRRTGHALSDACLSDPVHLQRIASPICFLIPANDFNGTIYDLQTALKEIKSKDWRVTCSPHHNHQDTAEYESATLLWMDQHLKGAFVWPSTPETKLELKTVTGVPSITVRPDASRPIERVDVFYTQQGAVTGDLQFGRENTIAQFWHYARTRPEEGEWIADTPLLTIDRPFWVYANVLYRLDHPVSGVGYYYGDYTTSVFNISSRMDMVSPDELKAAGVRVALAPTLLIESFTGEWHKEWYTYKPAEWGRSTHKVYSDRWKAPEGAVLQFEVRADQSNRLVVGIDQTTAEVDVQGGPDWQLVTLSAADFRNAAGTPRTNWTGIKELRLVALDRLNAKQEGKDVVLVLGGPWMGTPPQFRNLCWSVAALPRLSPPVIP